VKIKTAIRPCPLDGDGKHQWIYATACHLFRQRASIEDILRIIQTECLLTGRVDEREIASAVKAAWKEVLLYGADRHGPVFKETSKWPAVDAERAKSIAASGPGLYDLWELSPVRFDDDRSRAEEVVDALFPGNPLLCCGWSTRRFGTGSREEWRKAARLANLQFIAPSPMTAEEGRRKSDGELSPRTLDNTGPRRFLVIEFDRGDHHHHAALLWHLKETAGAPLVLALVSGGKSLHGWFHCAGVPEDRLLRFMRYAVSLGADSRTWSRCQFVRMPDGLRDNGHRQTVYYFNPHILN